MFLGTNTALLIARWLLENTINISHLLLSHNNFMDEGVFAIAEAICYNKTIVVVDLC